MRLIYPEKFKMHKKTLLGGINYLLGGVSGNIYLDDGRRLESKIAFEENPKDDSSLENWVKTHENRKKINEVNIS